MNSHRERSDEDGHMKLGGYNAEDHQKSKFSASPSQLSCWEVWQEQDKVWCVFHLQLQMYKCQNGKQKHTVMGFFCVFNGSDAAASSNFCSCDCSFPLIIQYITQSYVVSNKY